MAVECLVRLLQGKVTSHDLVRASLSRIEAVNPYLNSVVTLCEEMAIQKAHAMDAECKNNPSLRLERGILGGLPLLIKDLNNVKDVRTTYGCRVFENYIPTESDPLVQRIEKQGGIIIGKTNTPELGAGASTFNDVFGYTANPWDTSKSCAGSSGGSAASIASGLAFLASGSDLGGSLRTPASFCGVAGLRPSPSRTPMGSYKQNGDGLIVEGPMARNVPDIALFMDSLMINPQMNESESLFQLVVSARELFNNKVVSQNTRTTNVMYNIEDDLSNTFQTHDLSFRPSKESIEAYWPKKIAYSPDFGGMTVVDDRVAKVCQKAVKAFSEYTGCTIYDAYPKLLSKEANEVFQILRAYWFSSEYGHLVKDERKKLLKPEVVWNIEKGLDLEFEQVNDAVKRRNVLVDEMQSFFKDYDAFFCPAAIVPPFPLHTRYISHVGNTTFESYVDWISITFAISLTKCPVLSIPVGFTNGNANTNLPLPIGMQLVAPVNDEKMALVIGRWLEMCVHYAGLWKYSSPINPRN